uniref:long-chain-fatty-acid--CoA ligase n=2 Tax=Clastoptera arizonana TaxID=38151 RepID=A0A1B6DSZ8_9HEMI
MDPILSKLRICIPLLLVFAFTQSFVLLVFLFVLSYFITMDKMQLISKRIESIPVDIRTSVNFIIYILKTKTYSARKWTTAQIFQSHVKKHPDKIAFKHEDSVWTYQEVEDYSNQVSNFFFNKDFKKGDAVAIFVETRPEYVCYWLGLSKFGVISALINTNQRKDVLTHSIKVAKCKAVIVGVELLDALLEVLPSLPGLSVYVVGKIKDIPNSCVHLDEELKQCATEPLTKEIAKMNMMDPILYIYTSGTTGLPKAAIMSHCRFLFMTLAIYYMLKIKKNDIVYDSLPLYHTAGGMLGVGQVLINGCTVALRSKFSVSNFWTDCIKYECTVAQYIGEMCRYLLASPERPEEKLHKVRLVFGNGLRSQIWNQFVNRFNIKQIGEFYGATEGNANMINIDSTPGAVGYVPWFAKGIYPVTLIKVHQDSVEPIRNQEGFCIRCKSGEAGILIGSIKDTVPSRVFNGYADSKESEKKILKNVFEEGDKYFNTGDILVQDDYGYFYFKDRTGDTFRWKGENVATSEVEAVISNVVGLRDAIVFGVEIPNLEGRAGMAVIVDEDGILEMEELVKGMKESLPSYARPIFLRVIKQVPITGTFKLQKTDLQKEGFNPITVNDPLYFFDQSKDLFTPINKTLYEEIISGKRRL